MSVELSEHVREEIDRWVAKFPGAVTDFAALADGSLLAAGTVGTEVHLYTQSNPAG